MGKLESRLADATEHLRKKRVEYASRQQKRGEFTREQADALTEAATDARLSTAAMEEELALHSKQQAELRYAETQVADVEYTTRVIKTGGRAAALLLKPVVLVARDYVTLMRTRLGVDGAALFFASLHEPVAVVKDAVFAMLAGIDAATDVLRVAAAKILQVNLRCIDGLVKRPFCIARLPQRCVGAKEQAPLIGALNKATQLRLQEKQWPLPAAVDVLVTDGAFGTLRDGFTDGPPTTLAQAALDVVATAKADLAQQRLDPPDWASSGASRFYELCGVDPKAKVPAKQLDAAIFLGDFLEHVVVPDSCHSPQLRGWKLHRPGASSKPEDEQPGPEPQTAAQAGGDPADPDFECCVCCGAQLELCDGLMTDKCTKRKPNGDPIQLHENRNRAERNKRRKAARERAAAASEAARAHADSAAGQAEEISADALCAAKAAAKAQAAAQAAAASVQRARSQKGKEAATARAVVAANAAAGLSEQAVEAALLAKGARAAVQLEAETAQEQARRSSIELLLREMVDGVVANREAELVFLELVNSGVRCETQQERAFWLEHAPIVVAVEDARWHQSESEKLFDSWSAMQGEVEQLQASNEEVPVPLQIELRELQAVLEMQQHQARLSSQVAKGAEVEMQLKLLRVRVARAEIAQHAVMEEMKIVVPDNDVPLDFNDERANQLLERVDAARRDLVEADRRLREKAELHRDTLEAAAYATRQLERANREGSSDNGDDDDMSSSDSGDDRSPFFTGASWLFGPENAGASLQLPKEEQDMFEAMHRMRPAPTVHPIDTQLPNVTKPELDGSEREMLCKLADLLTDIVRGDDEGTSTIWQSLALSGPMQNLLWRLHKVLRTQWGNSLTHSRTYLLTYLLTAHPASLTPTCR